MTSLCRISILQHGNKLARLSSFEESQESLRIALCSTDKCLALIREKLDSPAGRNEISDRTKRSLQVQDQEMLVLSKQSFYVLCHVLKSTEKFDEARKCLDRIELYIDEQLKKDNEQYKEAMKRITKSENRETNNTSSLSGFAIEGK